MIALFLCSMLCAALPIQETIGGHPYTPGASREATHEAMLSLLVPTSAQWGDWWQIGAFPYEGFELGALARSQGPEAELGRMGWNGPGPDYAKAYAGKKGSQATWRKLGDLANQRHSLNHSDDSELINYVCAFLHTTITSEVDQVLELTGGSDDGLRMWLNGALIVDNDVPRGLSAEGDQYRLELKAGVNHLLAKIGQGGGGWEFQLNYRPRLKTEYADLLSYYLDRDFPINAERDHYSVLTVGVPDEVSLEVGGLAFLKDGTPLVATRRGDVWRVQGAYAEPALGATYERFASGLHEPLGLAVQERDGIESVYAVQRPELTRLVDEDGDGRADLYECFSDGWGVSGNYHEFAFGPKFDSEGNAWVTLNVGFCGSLGKSVAEWRGWALKITPAGEVLPVASGLRSPNGMGQWSDGSMFYVDNQGDYVATNRMSFLGQDTWHGHPASVRWRQDADKWGESLPPRQPEAIWFPYRKMGQSVADVLLDDTGGAFGPFEGQLFVGDQTLASVMRVFLEEVDGHYQGACFPFLEGLQCGVNRLAFAPDGSLFVGQTDRGWGSVGGKPYGLQRISYRGELPFEILAMRAVPQGFELEFTQDVDPASLADLGSYQLESYTYAYHALYGAPESESAASVISRAEPLGKRRVILHTSDLRTPFVHELHASGVRSLDGKPLLHDAAYYTLVKRPRSAK